MLVRLLFFLDSPCVILSLSLPLFSFVYLLFFLFFFLLHTLTVCGLSPSLPQYEVKVYFIYLFLILYIQFKSNYDILVSPRK